LTARLIAKRVEPKSALWKSCEGVLPANGCNQSMTGLARPQTRSERQFHAKPP